MPPMMAQCTVEEIVYAPMPQDVPQVVGERVEMVQPILHQERVVEQGVDVPMPEMLEDSEKAMQLVPQECILEQVVGRTWKKSPIGSKSFPQVSQECVEVWSLVSQEQVQRVDPSSASHVESVLRW